jgi:hypothetical protein
MEDHNRNEGTPETKIVPNWLIVNSSIAVEIYLMLVEGK